MPIPINPTPGGQNISYAYLPLDHEELLLCLNRFMKKEVLVRFTPKNKTESKDVKAFLEYFFISEEFNPVLKQRYNLVSMLFKGDWSKEFKPCAVTNHEGSTTTNVMFIDGLKVNLNLQENACGVMSKVISPEVYKKITDSQEPSYVNRVKHFL